LKKLLVIGAGGHGSVVADTAEAMGNWQNIEFVDDRFPGLNQFYKWKVIGNTQSLDTYSKHDVDVIVAIGNNKTRMSYITKLLQAGFHLATIVHPDAYVSPLSTIGMGTVVFAKCVVNAGSHIGVGSILNTGCTVDHGCMVGNGVHISPGAHIAGEVRIGDLSWIGIGASVIQRITIGSNVMVGAGAAIIRDIPDHAKVVGVPGRIISEGRTDTRELE
jgi:sugar O-acyltransferase (sialic acid O-acetyltransferase NeuD family)